VNEQTGPEAPPQTRAADIEGGIFNLTITLCHMYEAEMGGGREAAKERVAAYLERLIDGLRAQPTE
jgi:hypothetical protein